MSKPPPRRSRQRRGFSLAEILVALAILSVIAAVSLPALNGFIGQADSLKLVRSLHSIRKAINAFRADMYVYPSSLTELITAPVAGDVNICGEAIQESRLHNWHGPYLKVHELPILYEDDTIKTDFSRRDAGNGDDQGYIRVTVENVDSAFALKLEDVEGDDGDMKQGTLQWKRIKGQGYAPRLFYDLPIRGC